MTPACECNSFGETMRKTPLGGFRRMGVLLVVAFTEKRFLAVETEISRVGA